MAWLATPKSERKPATKEAWANALGVSRNTLLNWERKPGFWDAVWEQTEVAEVRNALPGVLRNLVRIAQEGGDAAAVGAARLLLQVAGLLVERVDARVQAVEFTADDYAAAAKEIRVIDARLGLAGGSGEIGEMET